MNEIIEEEENLLEMSETGGDIEEGSKKTESGTKQAPTSSTAEGEGTFRSFLRLMSLAREEVWYLLFGLVALAVSSASFMLLPWFGGRVIDSVLEGDTAGMYDAILALVVVFVVSGVFTFFRVVLFRVSAERVVARLRKRLFAALLRQEVAFFDSERTGELASRLAADTEVLQDTVTVNISIGLRTSATVVGGICVQLFLSWKLTLLMLAVVPVLSVAAVVYGKYVKGLAKRMRDAVAQATDAAVEALGSVRTVRAFAAEEQELMRYSAAVDESFRLGRRVSILFGLLAGGAMIVASLAIAAVLWYGGSLVMSGELSVGTLSAFCMYSIVTAGNLGLLASLYSDLMKSVGASTRVFALLDRVPAMDAHIGGESPPDPSSLGRPLDIEFDHVTFAYPTRLDVPVLREFSLKIPAGKVVALVGYSGSGKSTIASLLARFYDPIQGAVRVGGRDLRELDAEAYRGRLLGMVTQEPTLFARSIRENIVYGARSEIPEAQVRAAAEASHALGFIENFPEGMDTLVGERGVQLSGGQKQRIAIARVMLKGPAVLILDEATSALDAESEHLVQLALDRLMAGRTTLIIAHRLSTVRNADLVVVLDHGVIVQQGLHDDLLLDKQGPYFNLVQKQLSGLDMQ